MLLSIVVPTFNERENVNIVADRVREIMQNREYELIFVDDSKDDTPTILEKLSDADGHVRFEHRTNEKGLGTAVVHGFQLARGDAIAVMDSDLQHPPEMLLNMLKKIEEGADVVIPSRFVDGGDDGGLRWHRKVVSGVARYLGKALLQDLRNISDPTGGFFMFRRSVIEGVALKPIGWKILIEVLVRGHLDVVREIPYRFEPRFAGESKMSIREQWNYIKHLLRLIVESPKDRRVFLFSLVGLSGVLINMTVYDVLVRSHFEVTMAGELSALVALFTNFILNDKFTWKDTKSCSNPYLRAGKYVVTSLIGICINVGVLAFLFHLAHVQYLIANLTGIAVATVWNYVVNDKWTWARKKRIVAETTNN